MVFKSKYQFTEQMDDAIKQAYETDRPNLKGLSARFGMPAWAIKKRARRLGVQRPTDNKPWTDDEQNILSSYYFLSEEQLQRKLASAGYKRSLCAIRCQITRLKIRQTGIGAYDAKELSICFGVDAAVIARWIRLGLLNAERRGTVHVILDKNVKDFMKQNPTRFDLRKVDQLWLMDLVFDGEIAGQRKRLVHADGSLVY